MHFDTAQHGYAVLYLFREHPLEGHTSASVAVMGIQRPSPDPHCLNVGPMRIRINNHDLIERKENDLFSWMEMDAAPPADLRYLRRGRRRVMVGCRQLVYERAIELLPDPLALPLNIFDALADGAGIDDTRFHPSIATAVAVDEVGKLTLFTAQHHTIHRVEKLFPARDDYFTAVHNGKSILAGPLIGRA